MINLYIQMARHEFQVGKTFHRRRLDEFLFNEFRSLSKAYLRSVMKSGGCEVNGAAANAGQVIREQDFIEIEIDESKQSGMTAEELPLSVLYEDRRLLVVDKPAGLLVHPTNFERNGTLLNAMTFYLNREAVDGSEFVRPHLIHRLDRETSGVLIAAKDQKASRILCSHFKRSMFEKEYLAALAGDIAEDEGVIELPIGRNSDLKLWEARDDGKESETRYRVLRRLGHATIVSVEPVTGRTNQIRIHCAAIGHPVLGDALYGGPQYRRLCLHSTRMNFWHPEGGRRVEVISEADFLDDPALTPDV